MSSLDYQLENNQLSHAYIFESASQSYNLDYAKEFASKVFKSKGLSEGIDLNPDLYIIDKGNEIIDIETIREMLKDTALRPSNNEIKIYIIHNAHNMRQESSNALLKTVEELKSYNMVIFTTTNRDSLLPTIISRCQIISLNKSDEESSVDLVKLSDIIKEVYKGNMAYYYQNKNFFNSYKEEKKQIVGAFTNIFQNILRIKYGLSPDLSDEVSFNLKSLEDIDFDKLENIMKLIEQVNQGFKTNINYDLAIEEIILLIFRGGMS